jgi:hypothetical protein
MVADLIWELRFDFVGVVPLVGERDPEGFSEAGWEAGGGLKVIPTGKKDESPAANSLWKSEFKRSPKGFELRFRLVVKFA